MENADTCSCNGEGNGWLIFPKGFKVYVTVIPETQPFLFQNKYFQAWYLTLEKK